MSFCIPLPGSQRLQPPEAVYLGVPAEDDPVQVTVVLNRKSEAPHPAASSQPLSRAEFAELHGADPTAVAAVEAFAMEHHLSVAKSDHVARTVALCGTVAQVSAAFGVDVQVHQLGAVTCRLRQGPIHIPESLSGSVLAVLGIDNRPTAHTYHSIRPRSAGPTSFSPPQLAKIYNFPPNTGKNQTIAIIELGGGYRNGDLQNYWRKLGLPNVSVVGIAVDRARNAPTGDANGPDGEVVLDIQVAGGVAPGARVAVYFAPNTDEGFLNAINAAIHDKTRKPSVISISWGAAETQWTPQAMNAFNAAFHDAALLGISVCVASGDNGSSDGVDDGKAHVDFPASSPWVLACGGTTLLASNGKIQSETVWNDGTNTVGTGGGVSSFFSRPTYQANCDIPAPQGSKNTTGRGVPDVCAVADAATGYNVLVDGTEMVVGGTSAVAPLWAGLIALLNEQLGKNLGWFHPALYGTIAQHKALNDITSGTNGAFSAGKIWDACTGLGSPNGAAILAALKSTPAK
ncbi:MAG TPA: S53 family peptidase [Bryobacteraceae bacterium]|nr:S53 family peptidase [Bryobacteraceae bacterium]